MRVRAAIHHFFSTCIILTGIAWCGTAGSDSQSDTVYRISDYLPVSVDGYRYTSVPYGELAGILKVVYETRTKGGMQRISSRGLNIPNKSANRIVSRHDYTFPVDCGGASFSYYEGDGFAALAFAHEGTVVLDVLEGGGPYTAPRLWGPYDQVLNDSTPMVTVASFNSENGSGLMNASFMAGKVTGMQQPDQERLGTAYSNGIYTASRCVPDADTGTLLVTK